jgi:hypothetical protein
MEKWSDDLAVDFAAVADFDDRDDELRFSDLVDDAVIANADAPGR